jgi:hypothetical protein
MYMYLMDLGLQSILCLGWDCVSTQRYILVLYVTDHLQFTLFVGAPRLWPIKTVQICLHLQDAGTMDACPSLLLPDFTCKTVHN